MVHAGVRREPGELARVAELWRSIEPRLELALKKSAWAGVVTVAAKQRLATSVRTWEVFMVVFEIEAKGLVLSDFLVIRIVTSVLLCPCQREKDA
jgi:hypothetical protein